MVQTSKQTNEVRVSHLRDQCLIEANLMTMQNVFAVISHSKTMQNLFAEMQTDFARTLVG